MAFIVLLMTTLTSLTSVELSSATQNKQLETTRENALFGLLEARSEVQQYIGPDARITARNEIFDLDPTTIDLEGPGNPWLTTVWNSSAPTNLPRHLISGNEQADFDPLTATDYPNNYLNQTSDQLPPPPSDDTIALLYSDPSDPLNDIFARKQSITGPDGNITGRYAWAVLDEGIKANINTQSERPLPQALVVLANQALSSPETVGIELLEGMSHLTYGTPAWEHIQKSTSLSTLDTFSASDDSLAAQSFHDVTFDSMGVLSKTTYDTDTGLWGGLKFDLTNAMSPDGIDPSLAGQQIFPAATGLSGDQGGPAWEQLHAWMNLTPSNGNLDANAVYQPVPYSSTTPAITPVLTLVQLHVNVLVLKDPVTPNQYAIWYFLQPAFVLWNPYDAAIENGSFVVDSQLSNSSAPELKWLHRVEWHPLPDEHGNTVDPIIKFPNSGDTTEDGNLFQYVGLETPSYGRIPFRLNLSSDMEPGEAIVFTPALPAEVITSAATPLELSPGYRSGFAYAFKVPNSEMTIDPSKYNLGALQTISQQRVSGIVRLARNTNELATQPLQHIERLNMSGFNKESDWGKLYASGDQLQIYGPPSLPSAPPIEDISANFAYRAGLKFAQSRLQKFESSTPSSVNYFRTQWLEDYDPTAAYSGRSPLEYEAGSSSNGGTGDNPSWISEFFFASELSADPNDAEIPNSGDNAFVGFIDDSTGNLRAPLFHLPRSTREFRSIADLRHARLGLARDYNQALDYWKWGNVSPAYAIGSSSASPYLEPNTIFRSNWPDFNSPASGSPVYYDMPWNLNTALWDDYFFSAVADSNFRNLDFISENPRIFAKRNYDDAKLDSADEVAGELFVHGAFNVNSTSVDAWKALLGTYFGSDVETAGDTSNTFVDKSPWLRHPYPLTGEINAASDTLPEDDEAYTGFRTLDADEIDLLATAIVEEVKTRGPFMSLAQFVNRSPVPTSYQNRTIDNPTEWQQKGALQAAIDKSGINDTFFDADNLYDYSVENPENLYRDNIISTRYFREFNRDAMEGSLAANTPGYLTQGDLLAQLGSVLTVRSDTFRIRVWAESVNPMGVQTGETWCEAVIQRTPEKLDASETIALGDPTNGRGRRFVVTSFRWLDSPDAP
ncbi:hypothetical protein GCM10007047_27400 [Cerasicoccus arenae]|uniref:Uncharacterized protein n=2 Tax=Cerasicoccus arenae TaxID=424488 RepID=A0A8J3DJM7_9BACT|nr:hypothetical protein GCM10007047_27400 [Cerasicoccus arenae]